MEQSGADGLIWRGFEKAVFCVPMGSLPGGARKGGFFFRPRRGGGPPDPVDLFPPPGGWLPPRRTDSRSCRPTFFLRPWDLVSPSSLEGASVPRCRWAGEADAVLEVVYVAEESAEDVVTTQHFRVPEYIRQRTEEALQELRRHIPDEARAACTIHERVAFGQPAAAILEVARESGADMIVLGAGDRAHLRSLWLGSATSRIAHDARCPILVVPTPALLDHALRLEAGQVAPEYWADTFERVSLAHQGDPATISVLTAGFAAPEARALPFIGVTMDLPPSNGIAVILGSPDGTHLTHMIHKPTEVLLDESRTHAVTRLLIQGSGAPLAHLHSRSRHTQDRR